ncbi:MAG: hypothetical protein ABIG95_02880 [Candidatus Woesearchaeota archaeon]
MENKSNQLWFRKFLVLKPALGLIVIIFLSMILTSCSKPNQSQSVVCPELSNAILYGYDTQAETWVAEKMDYSTETEKLIFDERVEWRTSTPEDRGFPDLVPNKVYYMCDSGSRHIELGNKGDYKPDYVYCGDFIRPIVLYELDPNGDIINEKRTSVEIIFDSKTKNYVDTKCGTYELLNAVQTEESPGMPPSTEPSAPAPSIDLEPYGGPLSTGGYVYDDKLNYGFEYPDGWEIFIGEDLPDENIKRVVTFEKSFKKQFGGSDYESEVTVDIQFMVKSVTDLQEVTDEFKKEAEMSGLLILNEATISANNIDGYDILVGEDIGWKLRKVVFFANGTAYIFTYSSQDEFYRMYEETFNSIINTINIRQ